MQDLVRELLENVQDRGVEDFKRSNIPDEELLRELLVSPFIGRSFSMSNST